MKKLGRIQALAIGGLVAVALAVTFAFSFARAQSASAGQNQPGKSRNEWHWRGMGHGGGRAILGRVMRQLNLTDAQKTQMKQLTQSFRQSTQSLREQLRAKRQELRQAKQSSTFNEALTTQKLTEMAPLQAKLMGEGFKLRQQMLAVLTPEQKAQLDKLREQFKSKRAEHHGHQG